MTRCVCLLRGDLRIGKISGFSIYAAILLDGMAPGDAFQDDLYSAVRNFQAELFANIAADNTTCDRVGIVFNENLENKRTKVFKVIPTLIYIYLQNR